MTNTERIQAHNAELREAIEMAENLPDAGQGGTPTPTQEKTIDITTNGTHTVTPDEGYALSKVTANVNVPSEAPNIQPLEITENGTYTAPDGVDGYSPITVSIESSGGGRGIIDALIDRSITEVSSEVNIVGAYAFTNCQSLSSINFPNATTIQGYAFQNCYVLKSVSLPRTTGVNGYAFMNCSALASVDLPKLAGISNYAFRKCSALAKVDLPQTRSIGTYSFYECSTLETFILRKSDTPCTLAAANSFQYTPIASGTGYIYVPSALVDSYKTATNWSAYAAQIRAIEDYPDICGG